MYKLKLWTHLDENTDEGVFKDLYFDVSKITGFYIPEKNEDSDDDSINIFFDGDMITIKQEPHIVKYLTDKFVNTCVE